MTRNDYHSYDFLNECFSAKDSYVGHACLVQFIDKMIRLSFQRANILFLDMTSEKKLTNRGKCHFLLMQLLHTVHIVLLFNQKKHVPPFRNRIQCQFLHDFFVGYHLVCSTYVHTGFWRATELFLLLIKVLAGSQFK